MTEKKPDYKDELISRQAQQIGVLQTNLNLRDIELEHIKKDLELLKKQASFKK